MELKSNDNVLIFCICGKAKSGKSTIGKHLIDEYTRMGYKVISSPYTKYLKKYIEQITGKSINEDNKPRYLLQKLSSDLIKKELKYNDFFIRRQLEDISIYKYFFDIIVIPDVRFPEEISVLKEKYNNVISIGVNRVDFDNGLTSDEKNDITEISLDNYNNYDYVINNDKNIDLKEETKKVMFDLRVRVKI